MITFNVFEKVLYDGYDSTTGFTFLGSNYAINGEKVYLEGFCLQDDTKPVSTDTTIIANGSKLTEIDTTDVYLYNEEDDEWVKFAVVEEVNNGGGGEE